MHSLRCSKAASWKIVFVCTRQRSSMLQAWKECLCTEFKDVVKLQVRREYWCTKFEGAAR